MLLELERNAVVRYAKKMLTTGLVVGTGGNISIFNRKENLLAITPGSRNYEELTPEDIMVMSLDGKVHEGKGKPSSELQLHTVFYKNRPDIHAVVHTHSFYASSLACMNRELPAIHYLIASAEGNVRCAPYATFGTSELAKNALEGMENRKSVLLANHGLVSGARTIEQAFSIASNIEFIAGLYLTALAAGQTPTILSPEEVKNLNSQFTAYH
ncbi:MAG: L-fuculose-phosphate aldolase [Spirochaetes bacterium]|nr:MAG: L-fuculose-phosphate aldolase [Spirochaetota bacterium]